MWSEQLALGVQSDGSWLTSAAADEEGRPKGSVRGTSAETVVGLLL